MRKSLILLTLVIPALAACGAGGRASLGSRAGLVAGAAVAGPPGAMVGSALGAGVGALSAGAKPLTVLGAAGGASVGGPMGASLGVTGGQMIDARMNKKKYAKDGAEQAAPAETAAAAPAATDAAVVASATQVDPAVRTNEIVPEPPPLTIDQAVDRASPPATAETIAAPAN